MNWQFLSNYNIQKLIGKRLKQMRLTENASQSDIAKDTGLSVQTVQNIEYGKNVSINFLLSYMRRMQIIDRLEMVFPEEPLNPELVYKYELNKRKRGGYKHEH